MPISIERSKKTKQFYCRITGRNGEILMTGELLTRKANAVRQLIRIAQQYGTPWFEFVDQTKKVPTVTKITL